MFDLKKALSEWKRSLRKFESFEDGAIAELESHLLDEFDRQRQNGLADEEAFARAAAAVGRPEDVGGEYFKDSRRSPLASPSWRKSRFSPALPLNYLKVALRNFRRQAGYSLINILGLAIGIACSLLIVLWVRNESGYDRFHRHGRDIYRVIALGGQGNDFSSPAPFAPAVEAEVPEVAAAVRIGMLPRVVFQYEDRAFYEDGGIVADPALLRVFSFPLLRGDGAFPAPESVIVSASLARKYFGSGDPIGKTLLAEGRVPLKVVGVMKDVPRRSHLRFDFVLPFAFAEAYPLWGMDWGDFNFKTYVQLRPQRGEADVVRKLNQVALAHHCPQVVEKMATFSIQRLHDIYLNPIGPYDIPLGSKVHVYLFSIIAFFITLIAAINFINLSTARAEKRAKEIGLRRMIGADRRQIVSQFFGESLLITLLSLPLALLLARIALPFFNELTGKEFSLRLLSPGLLASLAGIACWVGLLAGVFPALYLSAIQPLHVFREGRASRSPGRGSAAAWVGRGALRRILVTTQFVIAIVLILATLVVGSQLRLIREKSWHLDRDTVLTLPIKGEIGSRYDRFREELLKNPAIVNVAAKDSLPTEIENNTTGVYWEGKREDQNTLIMETIRVDTNYFATMGMEIIAGRGFSADFPGDRRTAFVLNEQAVGKAGLGDAVGKPFALYDRRGTIIGIVADMVFQTLHQELRPQVFHLFRDMPAESAKGAVLVRVKGGASGRPLPEVIAAVGKAWNGINPHVPFEYHFLDQQIEAQYGSERRLEKLFATFAMLAIFISCLGLFGLVSFVAEQRTKEIGIRKVLGASVPGIMALLTRGFARQVLLANLLAWPLAYFFLRKWLQNFIYRISLGAGMFLFSGMLVLVLALLTAGFQALKVARMNPTKSLRYE
jgi:putative ABC transport system permease protein